MRDRERQEKEDRWKQEAAERKARAHYEKQEKTKEARLAKAKKKEKAEVAWQRKWKKRQDEQWKEVVRYVEDSAIRYITSLRAKPSLLSRISASEKERLALKKPTQRKEWEEAGKDTHCHNCKLSFKHCQSLVAKVGQGKELPPGRQKYFSWTGCTRGCNLWWCFMCSDSANVRRHEMTCNYNKKELKKKPKGDRLLLPEVNLLFQECPPAPEATSSPAPVEIKKYEGTRPPRLDKVDILLANDDFVKYTTVEVCETEAPPATEMEELKARAEFFQGELEGRHQEHMDNRLPFAELKDNHRKWLWNWIQEHLGVGGLYYLLLGMVDVESLAPGQARVLLLPPGTAKAKGKAYTEVTADLWKRMKTRFGKDYDVFGSYLQWDKVRKVWIRSGFSVRQYRRILQNHYSDSYRSKHPNSNKVYQFYVRDKVDYFRDEVVSYLGFACSKQQIKNAVALMHWSDDTLSKLEAARWGGKNAGVEGRKEYMVGYLMEYVGDLLLDPADRLSEAPGFEGPLGYGPLLSKYSKRKRRIGEQSEQFWEWYWNNE